MEQAKQADEVAMQAEVERIDLLVQQQQEGEVQARYAINKGLAAIDELEAHKMPPCGTAACCSPRRAAAHRRHHGPAQGVARVRGRSRPGRCAVEYKREDNSSPHRDSARPGHMWARDTRRASVTMTRTMT